MIPLFVLERAAQPIPKGLSVVPGTTPVVSFGSPSQARIATLSINPSHREFVDVKKVLLKGSKARLVDRLSLGVSDDEALTLQQAAEVVNGCYNYFENPKTVYSWFKTMEQVALPAFQASYLNGSACALDVSQWATLPIWSGLTPAQQFKLFEEDATFLDQQLREYEFELVLLNGAAAINQVNKLGIVQTEEIGFATYFSGATETVFTVQAGRAADGTVFAGWSFYIQNMRAAYADRAEAVERARDMILNYQSRT